MTVTIQLRGDLSANWDETNPVLRARELAVETDSGKAKLGDGVTDWASLGYWPPGPGGRGGDRACGWGARTAADVGAATGSALSAETARAGTAETALSASLAAEVSRAVIAEALSVPQSQSFSLANNTYKTIQQWTVTGQTDDPLPAFALVAGSQTYSYGSETTRGPAFWWGYNAGWLSTRDTSSNHSALGISAFADAGDSWNGLNGHGLEFNIVFRTQDGSKGTAAVEVVALDDNTNTVWTAIRCGTGSGNNGLSSGINFSRSDGSVTYMSMGPALADQIYTYAPMVLNGPAALTVNNANGAQQIVESAKTGNLCGWFFQQSGTNAWGFYEAGYKYFVVQDYYAGGGTPLIIWSAASTLGYSKQNWADYPIIIQGVD